VAIRFPKEKNNLRLKTMFHFSEDGWAGIGTFPPQRVKKVRCHSEESLLDVGIRILNIGLLTHFR